MQIRLRANASGEIRLTCAPDKPPPGIAVGGLQRSLVGSTLLQDSIYTGYAAMRSGYGWTPDGRVFGGAARRKLKEFGALLDSGPLEHCAFLTGTIPGSTVDALMAVATWSGWLTSRLSQWLRDRFPGAVFFGVWEYQKRGALHMHLIVRCIDAIDIRRLMDMWKKRWCRLLDGVSTRAGVDVWARPDGTTWDAARWKVRTDAQVVERSCGRYLAKYLSKSACKVRTENRFPPSAWWFACRTLRQNAARDEIDISWTNIAPENAHENFSVMAGTICGAAAESFPLTNKWDHRQAGVIGLLPAAAGGVLVRELCAFGRAAFGVITSAPNTVPASITQARMIFGGILLTGTG